MLVHVEQRRGADASIRDGRDDEAHVIDQARGT